MTYSQDYGASARTKVVVRGNSKRYRLTLTTPHEPCTSKNGPAPRLDLTGWTITSTWKWRRPDGQPVYAEPPLVQLSTDSTDEILILDQTNVLTKGQAMIFLSSHATKFFRVGVYRYDVVISDANGQVITVISDEVVIRDSVTSAEDSTSP